MSELSYVVQVLSLFQKMDNESELFWRVDGDDVRFFVNCSDCFFWGAADAEDITPETLPELEQAIEDAQNLDDPQAWWIPVLYAARRRKMRPQGALYEEKYLPPRCWPLFDACGPIREVGFPNPVAHP